MDLFLCFVLGIALAIGLILLRRRFAEFPGQRPDEYAEDTLSFDLKKHLHGKMICEGVIYGPLGRMTSSFAADFDITWDGDVGVMVEHFRYSDGSTQDREWTITMGDGGAFAATAPDVPGVAKGVASGGTVQMLYAIKLPDASGGHVLNAIDWMYLSPDGTIINRSQFRKFGLRVAELVATIRPVKELS